MGKLQSASVCTSKNLPCNGSEILALVGQGVARMKMERDDGILD